MSGVLKVLLPMVIWGSLGLFVKNINLESYEVAFSRAVIASLLLGIILIIKLKKENKPLISLFMNEEKSKKDLLILILSGVAVGFNWVFLFNAYNFTTVSNATLGYYFAPVIIVFLSPIFLKENFTLKRSVSVIIAMMGLFLIVKSQAGLTDGDFDHVKGISIALGAACFYAAVVMLNKNIKGYGDFERTFVQLLVAGIILLPFIIFRNKLIITDTKSLVNIIILGVVHTTWAYCLYFSAIQELRAQTTAFLGYIDPVSAIFFSVVFLGEPLSIWQVIGGSIVLVAAYVAERPAKVDERLELEV